MKKLTLLIVLVICYACNKKNKQAKQNTIQLTGWWVVKKDSTFDHGGKDIIDSIQSYTGRYNLYYVFKNDSTGVQYSTSVVKIKYKLKGDSILFSYPRQLASNGDCIHEFIWQVKVEQLGPDQMIFTKTDIDSNFSERRVTYLQRCKPVKLVTFDPMPPKPKELPIEAKPPRVKSVN